MKKINYSLIITFVLIAVFFVSAAYGQPFDPPDGGAPIDGPIGSPIDGGLSALIAAGVALVVRKFYKNRKAKKQNI